MDSHTSVWPLMDSPTLVWLRSEDSAFGALPRLKCNPKTFRGQRRWLHSAFFLSFFFGLPHFGEKACASVV